LAGRTGLEDALKKLDRLTHEEARMALAEVLRVTHSIRDGVKAVDGKVESVEDKVEDVGDKVKDRNDKVEGMSNKVQCVDDKVQVVIDGMQSVFVQSPIHSNIVYFQTPRRREWRRRNQK
jgi:uncharacterized protein YoxC